MWFGIISIFPEMFNAVTDYGVTRRAVNNNLLSINLFNPRDYSESKQKAVDDRPFGGGPGMIMKIQPIEAAIQQAKLRSQKETKVIYLSPQGKKLNQAYAKELAREKSLILLSGRYEGIDERLVEEYVDEEISIGDFVLSGGELPAMVLIDCLARLIPGVLGHADSAEQDSFMNGLLDCPHYTRPEVYNGKRVPEVLLSGNHECIQRWRLKQSLIRTLKRRADLLDCRSLSGEEKKLLDEFIHQQNDN